VVVILGEGDDKATVGELEAATARHLNRWTDEVCGKGAVSAENGDVELVAVGVSDEDVAIRRNINSVWEVGVIGASDFLEEISAIVHDDNLMAFEVAYIVYIAGTGPAEVGHGQVRRFLHVFGYGKVPPTHSDGVNRLPASFIPSRDRYEWVS